MDYDSLVWVSSDDEDNYSVSDDESNSFSSDVDHTSLPDLVSSDDNTEILSDNELPITLQGVSSASCPPVAECRCPTQLPVSSNGEQSDDGEDIIKLEDLQVKFKLEHRKFNRACVQMDLLSAQLRAISLRIRRADRQKNKSLRYVLKFQYKTVHGVKEMFYHYASTRADKMDDLRALILEAEGRSDSEGDLSSESDSD